jgi:hypothetical protein
LEPLASHFGVTPFYDQRSINFIGWRVGHSSCE